MNREQEQNRDRKEDIKPGKNDAERRRQEDDLKATKTRPKEGKLEDEEIDDELDQTFPASDPPSYSKPGNDRKGD